MIENWETLKYKGKLYNKYEISDKGNVRNAKTHKLYKQNLGIRGYMQYTLYLGRNNDKKSIVINMQIHRAVAETFIPNPDNLPVVNHKNGIKTFNYVENLEWCTIRYNTIHARDNGLLNIDTISGSNNVHSKLTNDDILFIRNNYGRFSYGQLAKKYNVTRATIINVIKCRTYKNV